MKRQGINNIKYGADAMSTSSVAVSVDRIFSLNHKKNQGLVNSYTKHFRDR